MGNQLTIEKKKDISWGAVFMCEKALAAIINCTVASADGYNFLNYHETTDLCNTAEISLVCDSWFAGEPIPSFDNDVATHICDAICKALYNELTNQLSNFTTVVFICPPN